MALACFALQADANFIHFPPEDCVQREDSANALVDKVFGIAEASLDFILAAASCKSAGVISRAVSANAEVICLIDLPVIVAEKRKQILELIRRSFQLGEIGHTITRLQYRPTHDWILTSGG